MAATWMMSPPRSTLVTTAGPPKPATLEEPESIDWTITAEAPTYTMSTSREFFSKSRVSLATTHGKLLRPSGPYGNASFVSSCDSVTRGKSSSQRQTKPLRLKQKTDCFLIYPPEAYEESGSLPNSAAMSLPSRN